MANLTPAQAKAEVIFEGYYKVSLSGVHSGYAIQRYELDAKKKEFSSTYYLYVRTSPDGKKFLTESLVTKSNDKFHPKSYSYTAISNGQPTTIDGKFSKGKLIAKINKGGKPQTKTKVVPQGTFMSTMLIFLILQKGIGVGKNFSFNAIAEEDAEIMPGSVSITKEVPFKGRKAFKMDYEFKGVKSVAYLGEGGHALFTEAPLQKVSTELVTSASDATASFPFPKKTLKALFNGIPTGQKNELITTKAMPEKPTSPKSSLKAEDQ